MSAPRKKSPGEGVDRHWIVGISGASGAIYACRLVEALLADPTHHVHLTITAAGARVLNDEIEPISRRARGGARAKRAGQNSKFNPDGYFNLSADQSERLHVYPTGDIGGLPASGTFQARAMIVVPCSMNTLAAIAGGLQGNLLTRAAGVTLKEGRPLLLVPRETPFGLIELRNMVAATEAGATIIPANPGFYFKPETIDDLVRFIVQKLMDRLGVEIAEPLRWTGSKR